ncbi:hypothetical protein [Rhodophyticola porphyridii]|uniref:hypothetical protein n=1 Tax=Rhodophyticola porphyridii TaxID=1852017 RepID=UPI001F4103F0|nr:hypothetical protein [Rhodophyticola porphyridii]
MSAVCVGCSPHSTGTNFQTGSELRQWLNSESVTAWSAQPEWPTPDTRDMWLAFTKSFVPADSSVWTDRRYWANVEWGGVQPPTGSPVQIHHMAHMAGQPQVLAPDGELLGTVKAALNPGRVGLLRAQVAQKDGRIDIAYLGPADLSSRKEESGAIHRVANGQAASSPSAFGLAAVRGMRRGYVDQWAGSQRSRPRSMFGTF